MAKLSTEQVSQLIKQKLRESPAVHRLFEHFDLDIDRLDDLVIEIVPLDKKYAETDAQSMRLNTFLFEDNFFENYFFVVPHELVHWLSRIKESEAYLNDPEEVLGFIMSVAYEIERGTDFDIIYNRIYPKINWHFHNEHDAREFFENMIEKALEILNKKKGV